MNKVIQGDCLEVMRTMPDNSVDSIVTDPPYGLSFMGKKWDYDVPSVEIWKEALRVLKPGGYLLSFAGTRTQHRMACNIEDAGFEIRDMIAWIYGSGFPKSLNIGKAVDKLQGNDREVIGDKPYTTQDIRGNAFESRIAKERPRLQGKITKGTSQWEGWGTALKPAYEPITVARKPLSEKTVAENVLKYGTGGINIDESRVEIDLDKEIAVGDVYYLKKGIEYPNQGKSDSKIMGSDTERVGLTMAMGRFPANLIHDGSDEVVGLFPNSKSGNGKSNTYEKFGGQWGKGKQIRGEDYGDSGSASRFFYCAKASKRERGEDNKHPTVKPIALMEYLIKLVSREDSIVLDPFAGAGSTGIACKNLNRRYILIEKEQEYIDIMNKRLRA